MARLIRRDSMERLELYDLDKLITMPSTDYQQPPPLPPPLKYHQRRSSMNPTFERYKFLCNMTRNKTDPVYAATPMFRIIPQPAQTKHPRQLLGSYVRLENVKPLPAKPANIFEPKTTKIIEEEKENKDDHNNEGVQTEKETKENDDDGDVDEKKSSSSDDDEQGTGDNDILADDDDKKGVVEQIFNRDKND